MIGSFSPGQMTTRRMMECWWGINTASVITGSIDCRRHQLGIDTIFANATKMFFEIEISKTFTFNEKRTSIKIITFEIKLIFWTDVIPITKAPPKIMSPLVQVVCFSWQEKLIVYKRWLPFVQLINQMKVIWHVTNECGAAHFVCHFLYLSLSFLLMILCFVCVNERRKASPIDLQFAFFGKVYSFITTEKSYS